MCIYVGIRSRIFIKFQVCHVLIQLYFQVWFFTFGGIKVLVIYVWRYWIVSEIQQKYLRSACRCTFRCTFLSLASCLLKSDHISRHIRSLTLSLGILDDVMMVALCACRFDVFPDHLPLVTCLGSRTSIGCTLLLSLAAVPQW